MSYEILKTPGNVVSFDTVPTPILQGKYANVSSMGVVGYEVACLVEDITAKYQQIAPYIQDVSTDFTKAEYVLLKHASGETEVLALVWIEPSTITSSSVINKQILIYNVASTDDAKLAKMLRLAGYSTFSIKDA